jgi:thiol-disulfide isomerase/thioredoxin
MSLLISAGIVATLLAQGSGAELIAKHTASLQEANQLKATFTVANLPAAPVEYKLEFAKPGQLRIETPSKIYLSDGKTYVEYDKSRNEYVASQGDARKLLESINSDEFAAWAAFFLPEQFKGVKAPALGKKISMKGTPVQEVVITTDSKQTTLFIDTKEGVARGGEFKIVKGGITVTTLVIASSLEISDTPGDLAVFSMETLPANAKKVEVSASDLTKWYYNLDEGLKVAKATNRMVFLDFNASWCGPCQMYKRNVFPTSEFQAMGKYFVFVDIDTDEQPGLAQQWGVRGIPDLRFLKPDGTEVHKVVGYMGMALIAEMNKAAQMGGLK